ncbi:MAG: hypothetical protein K6F64_03820 [Clostridia bacterium]|nr:hypothetical protein [Clostridia bacterium]
MYNGKKLALSIFWVLVGAALLVLSVTEVLDMTIFAGMGGGLIAVGVLQIIRNVKYMKNTEYREKIDVEVNDERNTYLRMKSSTWTVYLFTLLAAVASLVAMFLGERTVQYSLMFSISVLLVIYWISYLVLSRKY